MNTFGEVIAFSRRDRWCASAGAIGPLQGLLEGQVGDHPLHDFVDIVDGHHARFVARGAFRIADGRLEFLDQVAGG
jgi:hypothetical protein